MDGIVEILIALFHWRLMLSVAVSAFLGFILSQTFLDFTAGYCISLVLLGTAFGIIWQSRADAGVGLFAQVLPTPVSWPVAFLSFLIIGFFWGGLVSELFGSQTIGGIALVCSVSVVGLWYRLVHHHPTSPIYLVFVSFSLLCGFALLLFLQASYA